MKYKLLVLDVDGTLLNDSPEHFDKGVAELTGGNGFDYYKVSSTEYFAHGTDGTWWLLTDSGTFSKIR